jgi:cholesterol transport system auxiliary component
MPDLTRRTLLLGTMCGLSGCGTLSSLSAASEPLDTYDLRPVPGSTRGGRKSRTLLVAKPQASAALATDRIMIKPDAAAITYLPDARWSDETPAMLQALLIRSISETGRVAYVGRADAGPVPDKALLVRLDAFEVIALTGGMIEVRVEIDLTMVNDRDQKVVASQRFAKTEAIATDQTRDIVPAFQTVLDALLPQMSDWAVRHV